MYAWTINFLWRLRFAFISIRDDDTTIPWPLLEFYAGFRIHIVPFFLCYANIF